MIVERRLYFWTLLVASTVGCATSSSSDFTPPKPTQFEPGASDGAPGCAIQVQCSRDFHSVLCDGRVVETCADSQGCLAGRCVPACESEASLTGSIGCEFMTVASPSANPKAQLGSVGSCFTAIVANTWSSPAKLEVSYDGNVLDLTEGARYIRGQGESVTYEPFDGLLPPNEVVTIFLSQGKPGDPLKFIPCPAGVRPLVTDRDPAVWGTGRGKAFHIAASSPVSAYSIWPFGGAKSYVTTATLLLPLPSWRRNYTVVNAWETGYGRIGSMPFTQIVAAEDATSVTMVSTATVESGENVEGAVQGVPRTWTLGRGEMLQVQQEVEITGSAVIADKPITIIGGNDCMAVGAYPCDAAGQQLAPVSAWGTEYLAVPHASRLGRVAEANPWRIVAAADGTELRYDPTPAAYAPSTLRSGESFILWTRAPFVVKSQDRDHPIAVFGYMTGTGYVRKDYGDPEFVDTVPVEQYLDRYIFFVDPTYRESTLVVTRERGTSGFEDVILECGITALEGFQALGSEGRFEYLYVPLVRSYEMQPVASGTCGAGRHVMHSKGAFSVTVWGQDSSTSYAYPAGRAVRELNRVVPGVH